MEIKTSKIPDFVKSIYPFQGKLGVVTDDQWVLGPGDPERLESMISNAICTREMSGQKITYGKWTAMYGDELILDV